MFSSTFFHNIGHRLLSLPQSKRVLRVGLCRVLRCIMRLFLECFGVASTRRTSVHQEQPNPLCELPTEVLNGILEYLPPESSAVLALVNKKFHHQLRRFIHPAAIYNPPTKLNFLRLLERDSPHLLLCPVCPILYLWRHTYSYQCPRRWTPHSPHRDQACYGMGLCTTHQGYVGHVYIEVRDLLLRHAELGPEYGLPLDFLEHTCNGREEHPAFTRSITPKIVNGRLFVMHKSDQLIDLDDQGVEKQIKKLLPGPCLHTDIRPVAYCAVSHLLRGESQSDKRCAGTVKCHRCATDAQVSATFDSPEVIRLHVDVWHDLGAREFPIRGWQRGVFGWTPDGDKEDALKRRSLRMAYLGLDGENDDRSRTTLVLDWYSFNMYDDCSRPGGEPRYYAPARRCHHCGSRR
jgi:hypothetical protein